MCVCVCMCVCINCVYLFIVFFFECVGVLPFDGEIKMYILGVFCSNCQPAIAMLFKAWSVYSLHSFSVPMALSLTVYCTA